LPQSFSEFLIQYQGHLAGLAASFLWVFTSFIFTAASRRIGPTRVNTFRLLTACALLGAYNLIVTGTLVPPALAQQYLLLAVSGLVGLTIGDQFLFIAMLAIGPRLATLIMTVSPLFAALLGYFIQHESLTGLSLAGMALTISGVAWVVAERPAQSTDTQRHSRRDLSRGITFALLAAFCQAAGLMLSKRGIGHAWLPESQHLPPEQASLIRMSFAAGGALIMLALARRRSTAASLSSPSPVTRRAPLLSGILLACLGGFLGPTLGATASLFACNKAPVGVAQTLLSLSPVFMLPFVPWFEKERVSWRAIVGALIAVAGTALLFAQ